MNNEIYNERKAKYMTYDQRILCDKVFRDQECSDVKMECTEAMKVQNWHHVGKCSEFLLKYDNKDNVDLEVDEIVEGVILTDSDSTKTESEVYLTDTSADEPTIVGVHKAM